jgi:hypothetical protein
MIVPQFWAEARRQRREGRKQVTVRRFGWSDASELDAQAMADRRADEALELAWVDKKVPRREQKVPYNGADGLPIREQIVSRHGDVIVTRNSYGARCLNTPDACFVDIDYDEPQAPWLKAVLVVAVLVGVAGGWARGSMLVGFIAGLVALIVGTFVRGRFVHRRESDLAAQRRPRAIERVRVFMRVHPTWAVRVYDTPNGLRLLFTHDVFDPTSNVVRDLFDAVGADRAYVWMCTHQRCFRARLTAKPWRIGIDDPLRPRPGVWPVSPERLPERERWLAVYDATAHGWAACRFAESIGGNAIHAKVAPVLDLHDLESGALMQRPLA